MGKAVLAALVTLLVGWASIDGLSQLPEVGVVIAVAVMGGFIIYFNDHNKR